MLASISGESLRGHLSFIASPLLDGRDTPSRGLDVAAEYIAAQFRRAGLEPAGDDGYFQTAKIMRVMPPAQGVELRIQEGARTLVVAPNAEVIVSEQPMELSGAPVFKVDDPANVRAADVKGKVVEIEGSHEDAERVAKTMSAFQPAAFLETANAGDERSTLRLLDPDEEHAVYGAIPRLIVHDEEAASLLREAKAGNTGITVSIQLQAPTAAPVAVRNVAGWLRGSDPGLRDQYVLLTAHYDHLGQDASGAVFPGANDNGSGTVSVIEIAQALAGLRVHPKRSIVFVLFFGEEEGDFGSRYYVGHPLFPLARTVANLNLEQVGRTDSSAGPKISNATLTGFRYSDVSRTLQQAGELTGVQVYETPNDDEFFERSDNQTFAEHGIPAHTIVVAFEFPDYHARGDTWPKIDYDNMAKVDRMIALGTVMLADNPEAPQWNRDSPKAGRYQRMR